MQVYGLVGQTEEGISPESLNKSFYSIPLLLSLYYNLLLNNIFICLVSEIS